VFVPRQPRLHSFAGRVEREDLERLAELVAGDLGRDRAVVAIYPSWWAEPSLRRLQTIRAALDSPRFAVHALDAPPLAGAVFCAMAATLAGWVRSPGALMAALPALERQILPVAQLAQLSGLRHPSPSLGQHALSWLPWTSFAASWWPQPRIGLLRRRKPSVALPGPAEWKGVPLDTLAIAAPPKLGTAWFEQTVVPALGVSYLVEVEPGELTARYWSTHRVVEAAAFPSDTATVADRVAWERVNRACAWCGEGVVTNLCPFCGGDQGDALPPAEAPLPATEAS
jgi:hypothetical protein